MPLFCSRCGSENENARTACIKCEAPVGHVEGDANAGEMNSSDSQSDSGKAKWIITGVVCVAYLIYPSMSVFELIPDAIPIIGSLDEAAATTGLLIALSQLGLNPFAKYTGKNS